MTIPGDGHGSFSGVAGLQIVEFGVQVEAVEVTQMN